MARSSGPTSAGATVSEPEQRRENAAAFRNLGIFLVGQGLSNIGTFSQVVALSLLVLDLSGSTLALGATMSLQAVPQLLLSPWAGPLLDRLPLRRVMLATATVGALQATILAVLALTDRISMPWVWVLALMLGCMQVFDRPAVQAFLGELV
jgi:MFS family permease